MLALLKEIIKPRLVGLASLFGDKTVLYALQFRRYFRVAGYGINLTNHGFPARGA